MKIKWISNWNLDVDVASLLQFVAAKFAEQIFTRATHMHLQGCYKNIQNYFIHNLFLFACGKRISSYHLSISFDTVYITLTLFVKYLFQFTITALCNFISHHFHFSKLVFRKSRLYIDTNVFRWTPYDSLYLRYRRRDNSEASWGRPHPPHMDL